MSKCDPMSKQCSAMCLKYVANVSQMSHILEDLEDLEGFARLCSSSSSAIVSSYCAWSDAFRCSVTRPSGMGERINTEFFNIFNKKQSKSFLCYHILSKVVCLLMSAALFPFGQGRTSSYRRAVEINPFREIMPRNLIRRTLRLKPSHSSTK